MMNILEDRTSRYDAQGRELVGKAARLSQRMLDGADEQPERKAPDREEWFHHLFC